MILHSKQHEVVYIDPSIASAGDGSTPATALSAFPTDASTWPEYVAFIIRRTAEETRATFTKISPSSKSVAIIGMPKSTDELYTSMPEEAKAAWGSDSSEWAHIYAHTDNNRDYFLRLNQCMFFEMHHISYMTRKTGDGSRPFIIARNSTYGCSANVTNCWFRTDVDWVSTGTRPSDSRDGGHWLWLNEGDGYGNFGYKFHMENCRVDHYSRYSGAAIQCGRTDYIELKNIDVNVIQSDGSRVVFTCIGDDNKAPIFNIENVHTKYFYSDQNDRIFPTTMNLEYTSYGTIKNCSYKKNDTQHWTPRSNQVAFDNFINARVTSAGSVFQDITIEYPDIKGSSAHGITVISRDYYPPQLGQYTKLENINITCCQGNPVYTDYYDNADREGMYHSNNDYYHDQEPYHLVRVYEERESSYKDVSTEFLLKNLNINAPRGKAIRASYSLVDMKSNDVYGACYFEYSMGKIGSINSWYPCRAFCDAGSNLIHIGNMVFNRQNPSYEYRGQEAIVPSYRSNILVTDCNIEYMPNTPNEGTQYRCSYVCTNNNSFGGQGNYFVRNSRSFCRTWSVAREGSHAGCSLKLFNESGGGDWNHPLLIGGLPFKGISKIIASAGSHVATIYVTTYGYNDPSMIMDKLRIKMTKADGTVLTTADGTWSEDTTTVWNNIEAGTAYKFELPFTTAEANEEVEFEFAFSWDMIGGATYLDPHPVIE